MSIGSGVELENHFTPGITINIKGILGVQTLTTQHHLNFILR